MTDPTPLSDDNASDPDAAGTATPEAEPSAVPNTETGVGIGAGEANTFEPEELPEAVDDPKP